MATSTAAAPPLTPPSRISGVDAHYYQTPVRTYSPPPPPPPPPATATATATTAEPITPAENLSGTTMEEYTVDAAAEVNHASSTANRVDAVPAPAPPTAAAPVAHEEDDDEFAFNAPSYYDLKHPEREQQYVNNADGYFFTTDTTPRTSLTSPSPIGVDSVDAAPQFPFSAPPPPPPQQVLVGEPHGSSSSTHVPSMRERSYPQSSPSPAISTTQIPYGSYRQPHTEMADSEDTDMSMTDDTLGGHGTPYSPDESMAAVDEDDHMSDNEVPSFAFPAPGSSSTRRPASAVSSSNGSATSSTVSAPSQHLMRPTQAFLRRMAAEQARREQGHTVDTQPQQQPPLQQPPSRASSSRLTNPRSPRLHTRHKAQQRHSSEPKLSSTSRELQQIREEKLRLQIQTMKIREYHERMKAQRVATNVHQRSTKQLTVPQSPHLSVHQRSRTAVDGADGAESKGPHSGSIRADQLLSRDYTFGSAPSSSSSSTTGVAHAPKFMTAERAARRSQHEPQQPAAETSAPDYSKMRVNGITRPMSPQLATNRRAAQAATYRHPPVAKDADDEELAHKFHARPVDKRIFEAAPVVRDTATSRSRSIATAAAIAAAEAAAAEVDRLRQQRQQRRAASHPRGGSASSTTSSTSGPRRPVVPETPPLRSLYRHQLYQENLKRKQQAEHEEQRRRREFHAQPIRTTTHPLRFEGSKKPLTEVVPFALRSEALHERAQERLERRRREEEQRALASMQFRAQPMPVASSGFSAGGSGGGGGGGVAAPARPSTRAEAPLLASDRRAAERAAYDAAERARRAQEEAAKQQREEEKKRREEEELKKLRREQLTFHARPAPGSGHGFELKPASKPLTQPESPFFQAKRRAHAAAMASTSATRSATGSVVDSEGVSVKSGEAGGRGSVSAA